MIISTIILCNKNFTWDVSATQFIEFQLLVPTNPTNLLTMKKSCTKHSILINLMTDSRKSVSRRFDRLNVNYVLLEEDAQYFGRTPKISGLGVLQTPNNFKRIWDRVWQVKSSEYLRITYQKNTKDIGYLMGNLASTFQSWEPIWRISLKNQSQLRLQ